MKILLLSVNSRTFFYSQVVIPFGLVSLGSYVQDGGHIIRGIEMNTPPEMISQRYLNIDRRLLDEIQQYDPDLVAMSTYAENIHNVLFWSETIKKSLPKTRIVLGGNHASYIAREILEKCSAVDIIVRFEGEVPFKELCNKIEKNDGNYDDIPSITYRKNGKICENEPIGLIDDLNSLPPLNRDFFESQQFSSMSHGDIITARGCPFHCTFCNCNHYWSKRYRTISIQRILEELNLFKNRYPNLKTVRIRDESISINKKRCLKLCKALIEKKLGLKFQAHSRLDGLDEEVIKYLSMAGFNKLYIGLESGSQAVLDRLQKGIEIKEVYELVPLLRKYNISFRFSLMLATPEESMEEALKTIQLVDDLGLSFDEFYFGFGVTIYPGTSDCGKFLKKYPDHRWLERQNLGDRYRETLDYKGNVISVSYLGAKYKLGSLFEEINKRLRHGLIKYGETDYFNFGSSKRAVERIINHFNNKGEIHNIIGEFLRALDRLGGRWRIFREGLYYSEILADVCERTDFKNFAGIFSPQDETKYGLSAIRGDFNRIKYLVLSVSKREACSLNTRHYIEERWKFKGEMLLIDELLESYRHSEQFYNYRIDKIIRSIRLNKIINWQDNFQYRIVKILKTTRLYPVAKKVKNLIGRLM